MSQNFDVVVIGSGPGGYVCAIRAAQLGLKTAIVERDLLGGVCLNVGCIPSKAMISATHFLHRAQYDAEEMGIHIKDIQVDMKQLQKWKNSVCEKMSGGVQQLLKGNQVQIVKGEAQFTNPNELSVKTASGTEILKAKNFVVATGSRPIEIPGFSFDEKAILSSTGALALSEIPKSLVIIGGGYIGLEIGTFLRKLGSEVTIVEAASSLLSGVVDPECTQVVERKLKKNKVKILLNAKAKSQKKISSPTAGTSSPQKEGAQPSSSSDTYEVTIEVAGKEETLNCNKILVMVGRKPNSDQCNLKGIGLAIDERGFLKSDAQKRTSIPHIFAIGDITCQPMLAHKASYEGVMVAEIIAGKKRAYDVKTIPAIIFTDPEIASAGFSEAEAKAHGYTNLKIGKFPFAANGRATSLMETDGFVKIIADGTTHVVLGVHIVGPEASNLISEAALAIEMGARLEDLALTIHPHPTLGETMMEAAEATLGHAIHIIQKPLRS